LFCRPALAAVFDRESRREKYLEQRNREIRLKKRDADKKEAEMKKLAEENAAEREASGLVDTSGLDPLEAHRVRIRHEVRNNPLILAEREFFASIKQVYFVHFPTTLNSVVCQIKFIVSKKNPICLLFLSFRKSFQRDLMLSLENTNLSRRKLPKMATQILMPVANKNNSLL
jgi:hypothetical protein